MTINLIISYAFVKLFKRTESKSTSIRLKNSRLLIASLGYYFFYK
ncbi:hypothetical protein UT300002_30820 [Clostridium perfringens]